MRKFGFLMALIGATFLSCEASAGVIPVLNGDFEAPPLGEGGFTNNTIPG